jgi:uncharacterized membrane protein YcaP (DUF421 family)
MFFQNAWTAFCQALGIGVSGGNLSATQMGLRAAVVYIAWLAAVRFADKRLLGRYSAFDVVLAVILGAVLGRAINGSSPFLETMGAGAVLVGMHWLFAFLSARSHGFGKLVKGEERVIVWNGEVRSAEMRKSNISDHDLMEMLRLNGNTTDARDVAAAYLERNGQISVIPFRKAHTVEVDVLAGVQTVRIVL